MESLLAFIPITVMACRGLGYGTMTGLGLVLVSIAIGSAATTMSPYTVVIAQSVAGLPIYSGMEFRLIMHVVFFIIATAMMITYAIRVKRDPKKALPTIWILRLRIQKARAKRSQGRDSLRLRSSVPVLYS